MLSLVSMASDTITVNVRNIPRRLWKRVHLEAVDRGVPVWRVVVESLQESLNRTRRGG